MRALAIDTDVSPNLGLSLGLDQRAVDALRSVPRALINGRGGGAITTEQLVRGYGLPTRSGVTVLHAMPSSEERGGCCCPAHASGRSLLASALDDQADLAVLDIEAGLEHLDRPAGTVAHTDVLLVVLEPSRKSSVTAARQVALGRANGIERIALVANKATAGSDGVDPVASTAAELGLPVAAAVPWSSRIVDADRLGGGLDFDEDGVRRAAEDLLTAVTSLL